jgi:hypothetical protein
MATAKALGVDMATLFGGRKLSDSMQSQPETPPANNPPASEPPNNDPSPENNTANMAAQAASEDPDFPDEPTGPGTPQKETEVDRLGHSLDQIMTSYKAELDGVTKSGRNPYKMAEEELNNPAATEETRRSMIDRLMTYLKAKGINV